MMKKHLKQSILIATMLCGTAIAQPSFAEGWFVPKKPQTTTPKATTPKTVAEEAPQGPPVLPSPNIPAAPAVPKGNPPPALSAGVINVQAVMELSTASQEVQKVMGARREALQREAAKAENDWQVKQAEFQQLVDGGKATKVQLEAKARALQEERIRYQNEFSKKARIIQEAYQVAFHQIERELEQPNGIISQVASAHSMNMILHGEQVVLHVDGQDITREVAEQLNKVLPHVVIPAANEDPEVMAKSGKYPTTLDEQRQMAKLLSQNK